MFIIKFFKRSLLRLFGDPVREVVNDGFILEICGAFSEIHERRLVHDNLIS